ncbi:exo-alpha-sialidase [bacterium]|nr:exo-alpha-sialidase [bacterium]
MPGFLFTQKKTDVPSGMEPGLYKSMEWRQIGPFRGGRSVAVAGDARDPLTFYFGATGGGVWKTTDGGITWLNVSDGFFKTGAVGALSVAESDPNVIYAGMGETCIRGNITPGDGIYKSLDAGKTWSHTGLKETQFIGGIAIHPQNPDFVLVAAMGHIFGINKERGIYKTTDGGKTWKQTLYKDDKTGAVEVALDPRNPRIVYAALWEAHRNAWSMTSGGSGSGLYKSTDGGETWTDISKYPGLPKGVIGKIGISVSPVKDGLVWACIENDNGGVFRSDDGGQTWRRTNEERNLRQRAWYYSHIYADPVNSESVYALNVQFFKSVDGGRTFKNFETKHGDHHDLWIDPRNSERMIIADDGGAAVSYNGGVSWTDLDIPTAQFYHVSVDNQFPYNIYGAQQDNSTVRISSRTTSYGIDFADWSIVAGGESGYVVAHPSKPTVTFGGSYGGYLTRLDAATKQERNIAVWPDNPIGAGAADQKYRFQWTYPIVFSPHDKNTLYVTAQCVFRSTDEGQSWTVISGDLTRNDKSKQLSSGGPITKDNTSVEYYNTIFSLAESYKEKGVLWAGSDDGLIHISRDHGATWNNVTPKDFPEGLISIIEPSYMDGGVCYVAATRYKFDDLQPYLFKTTDYGKTWKRITQGIPNGAFTRVIRADPFRSGLLYAGTETGMFVSFNDGESWQSLQLNLPVVPIHDMAVQTREKDLVVATHGRSFWILDDLTPLHQIADAWAKQAGLLYKPRDAYRMDGFQYSEPGVPVGTNPPNGVLINYYLKEPPKEEVRLEFLNAEGNLITAYSSKKDKKGKTIESSKEFYEKKKEKRMDVVPADSGMNRFVWDMRYPDAAEVAGAIMWGGNIRGPKVVPGTYQVRMHIGSQSWTEKFEILKDPRVDTSPEDLKKQFELISGIHKKLNEVHEAVNRIRDVQKQITDYLNRIKDSTSATAMKKSAKPIQDSLSAIENELIQTKIKSSQDVLNYPMRLNNKLAALAADVASADVRPTDAQYAVYEDIRAKADRWLAQLKPILEKEIPRFNSEASLQTLPAINIDTKK